MKPTFLHSGANKAACIFAFAMSALLTEAMLVAAEPAKKLNIAFIVADDLRADVMSVYGGPVRTPQLEKLAAKGGLFRSATCGYPICHVSRSEMLSGRILVAEASSGATIPFDKSWTLWPQLMRKAGWRTIHSGKWHVAGTPADCGYLETVALYSPGRPPAGPLTLPTSATGRSVTGYVGWTFKDADGREQPQFGNGLTVRTDALIAEAAVSAIQAINSQPLFLHVNFTAPHDPLHWPVGRENSYSAEQITLPKNFREQHSFDHGNLNGRDELILTAPRSADDVRRERSVYYALVENMDDQVGQILRAIEMSPDPANWLIIFTSDQGLALGSHCLMGKQNQYQHSVNVPLILAGPGIPAGTRIENQCALRDLFPTVCEITGQRIPKSVQGKSVVPLLRGVSDLDIPFVYGYFTDTQRMIRSADGWKLIWYPKAGRKQLFQTRVDPDELNDLSDDPAFRDRMKSLKQQLIDWQRQHDDPVVIE